MIRLILTRLLQGFATLLMTSLIIFVLARSAGSPADLVLPSDTTPADRQAYIERMGLDKPLFHQYSLFLRDAANGDFGVSIRTGAPATELVFPRISRTIILATGGLLVAVIISIPIGVLAGVNRGRGWDKFGMGFALLGQSTPAFWLSAMLILIFAVRLHWLPSSGAGGWKHFLMPSVVLGWSISAGVVRLLRSSMLEVLGAEFVKLARAKGVKESVVVWKHALRNALIPVITFIGFMYGVIIASGVVIEVVFGWPGLGYLAYESTLWRDFPVLQLTVLVYTAIIVAINFLVDLSYGLIDPRVRG
jgi:peptide/nickel transport system permease protein